MDVVAIGITRTDGGKIMAGGDRRGPRGMGPMTGRGMGFCAGNDRPGFVTEEAVAPGRGFGRGFGRGAGNGRGFGRGFGGGGGGRRFGGGFGRGHGWGAADYPNEAPAPEYPASANGLAAEAAWLRERLASIEERLTEQQDKD